MTHKLGFVDNKINIAMSGGDLLVEIDESEEIYLTRQVEKVFEGNFHPDFIKIFR